MLYYSFSIAPPRAAMQLCCCCCCGFARFTVQARIERSLSLLLLFSLPCLEINRSCRNGWFLSATCPSVHYIVPYFHIRLLSRFCARTLSLCRSVLTCIYQLRGKIDYYFLFVYFTYFNNLLICLSIDFYVHLVIVSLPNCVCVCLCVKVYVSVCHCLLDAITRVWALQTAVCRRAFRTKKNARWKQSSAWLVGW